MPSYYVYFCRSCGHQERRYRNVKKCRKCGERVVRLNEPRELETSKGKVTA